MILNGEKLRQVKKKGGFLVLFAENMQVLSPSFGECIRYVVVLEVD